MYDLLTTAELNVLQSMLGRSRVSCLHRKRVLKHPL
jgi:hypothetical protein